MDNITINISGMTCSGCANSVERALKNVSGVSSVQVDFAKNCASISFDSSQTNLSQLTEAIENAGFDVE